MPELKSISQPFDVPLDIPIVDGEHRGTCYHYRCPCLKGHIQAVGSFMVPMKRMLPVSFCFIMYRKGLFALKKY